MQGEWMLMTEPGVLTGKTLDRFRVWYDGFLSGTDRSGNTTLRMVNRKRSNRSGFWNGHVAAVRIRMKGCLK